MKKKSIFYRYSYLWITLGLFLFSILGHWIFAWFAYVDEQRDKNRPVRISSYIVETSRDTLENWQSEFLQLMWQVGGLAFFLYLGSPQSKEGDDRREEKIDTIIKLLAPDSAEKTLAALDKKYPKN
jgi:hypothetical protein